MRPLRGLAGIIFCVSVACTCVFADTIGTYTFTGTATGSVGGASFSDAAFTVTAVESVSTITQNGAIFRLLLPAGASMFSLSGFGSATFTNPTFVFDTQDVHGGTAGFGAIGTGDLIDIYDSDFGSTAFATYTLNTSIGPLGFVADPPFVIHDWMGVPTSLGSMTVTSFTNASFQAVVAPVPEPSSSTMLIVLGIGVLCIRFLRRGPTPFVRF